MQPPPPPVLVPPLDKPALELLLSGLFVKCAKTKKVCVHVDGALPSRASQLSPALHVPFNTHSGHAAETLVTLLLRPKRSTDVLPPSPPASIDGCPVSLSRRFRKHQPLSDEVLTKGHGVEATEGKGADYRGGGRQGGGGVKERETEWSEGKSITQIQLSEAARS